MTVHRPAARPDRPRCRPRQYRDTAGQTCLPYRTCRSRRPDPAVADPNDQRRTGLSEILPAVGVSPVMPHPRRRHRVAENRDDSGMDERCCRGPRESGELHGTDISPGSVRLRWCCHEAPREDDGANDGAARDEVRADRPAHGASPTAISVIGHHRRPAPRPAEFSMLIVISPSLPWRRSATASRPFLTSTSSVAFGAAGRVRPYSNLVGSCDRGAQRRPRGSFRTPQPRSPDVLHK
jgi:hypothetical protein